MISIEKLMILAPVQKLPKNVGDLGKLIVAPGFEKLPKVHKSPNLVTLPSSCVNEGFVESFRLLQIWFCDTFSQLRIICNFWNDDYYSFYAVVELLSLSSIRNDTHKKKVGRLRYLISPYFW